MTEQKIPDELVSQLQHDRELIAQELPELHERDTRMHEASGEDTLCGHLRRVIHKSRRPLSEIAGEAGISTAILCGFLEGERTLRSDVLDRLTQAVGVSVTMTPQ